MQYKLPKRRFLPILLTGAFVSALLSLYILSRIFTVAAYLFPYGAALFLVMALYTVGRFLVFDTLYHLGDDYADFAFTVYRVYKTTSSPIAKVELFGKEELILLDRRGKKRLKKKKKLGVYTANLIPNTLYALFCEIDGVEGYILLELDEFAKNKINERIARAAHTYAIDER